MLILFIEIAVILLACWAAWLSIPRRKTFRSVDVFEYAYSLWTCAKENHQPVPSIKPAPLFDWESLVEQKERWIERLSRKSDHLVFFHLGTDLGLSSVVRKDSTPCVLSLDDLAQKVQHSSQRLIFTADESHVQKLLEFLHANPGLRDVVAAVICFRPQVDQDWVRTHFTHEQMDLEQNHAIPYLVLSEAPVFKEIKEPQNGWFSIELHELSIETQDQELKQPQTLCPALWNILDLILFQ